MMKSIGLFTGALVLLLNLTSPLALGAQTSAQTLSLGPRDVAVEARDDGYHLFIRQVPGAASVLLTDAFEPSDHKLATYALRAVAPNPANDNEQRLLDGKFLKLPHHSLVSSLVVPYGSLGPCFQIVLPRVVEFGSLSNPNSRYGKIDVQASLATVSKPVWFSIRVFAKPYADYSGEYKENAFELKAFLTQAVHLTADHYETNLREGFGRLGKSYPALNAADAVLRASQAGGPPGGSVDLVVCLDTTKSMDQNLVTVKANLVKLLRTEVGKFSSFRIGVVFYRDYMEEYLTRVYAFTSDLDQVQKSLDEGVADGGGDIPEAVVEGLWAGLNSFEWKADHRVIVCMGDAPQHPTPRGGVTEAMVRQVSEEKKVELQMIMLPQTSP